MAATTARWSEMSWLERQTDESKIVNEDGMIHCVTIQKNELDNMYIKRGL